MLLHYIFYILITGSFADVDPYLNNNVLRPQWGVNFKYNSVLHHNLAWMSIVTEIPLPPLNKFHFPDRNFTLDCDFNVTESKIGNLPTWQMKEDVRETMETYWFAPAWLRETCEHTQPVLSLLEKREQYYNQRLLNLVQNELYSPMPIPLSAGRKKRFAALAILALAGLVTLAVESISGYLQRKRNKAMARAMDTLHRSHRGTLNRLYKHEDDLLMYGTYSLNSTEEILSALKGLYTKQSSLERHITTLRDSHWPGLYMTSWWNVLSYGTELNYYIHTIYHKYPFLYTELIVQDLLNGIATLS